MQDLKDSKAFADSKNSKNLKTFTDLKDSENLKAFADSKDLKAQRTQRIRRLSQT